LGWSAENSPKIKPPKAALGLNSLFWLWLQLLAQKIDQVGTSEELSFVEVFANVEAKGRVKVFAEGDAPIKPAHGWENQVFDQAIAGLNTTDFKAGVGVQMLVGKID
jgi:hypothetical protein